MFCTKELSSLRILSSLHKVAYFYDVGSTYAIDQPINHLHKKSPNFVAGHHVVHFYFLQNQDLFQDLSTEM
jgi:hypothetical protein